jgi:hypothetical protein
MAARRSGFMAGLKKIVLCGLLILLSGCAGIQQKYASLTPGEVAEKFWEGVFTEKPADTYYLFSRQMRTEITPEQYEATINILVMALRAGITVALQNVEMTEETRPILSKILTYMRFKTETIHLEGQMAQVDLHMAAPALEALMDRQKTNELHKTKIHMRLIKEPEGWKFLDLKDVVNAISGTASEESVPAAAEQGEF